MSLLVKLPPRQSVIGRYGFYNDLDPLDMEHTHLLPSGDDFFCFASGTPHLAGQIHQSFSSQIIHRLGDHAHRSNDPVGIGGRVARPEQLFGQRTHQSQGNARQNDEHGDLRPKAKSKSGGNQCTQGSHRKPNAGQPHGDRLAHSEEDHHTQPYNRFHGTLLSSGTLYIFSPGDHTIPYFL